MSTPHFTLAIDKRERDILAILDEDKQTYIDGNGKEIKWRAEHLTIGDYIIFYGDMALVIIERKTWTDLAASFRDGRKENIRKLIQYREQTNARISYLIEGIPAPKNTARFARIPYRNLRAHLDHLLIRDGIIELRSTSLHNTIDRLFEFIRNISTLSADQITNQSSYANKVALTIGGNNKDEKDDDIDIVRKGSLEKSADNSNKENDSIYIKQSTKPASASHLELAKVQFKSDHAAIVEKLWCCVPAISTNSVKLFREYHIADLLLGNISEATIAQLQYTNGRTLGAKKAKKIFAVSKLTSTSNAAIYLRILTSLPSISRETASKILATFPMQKILTEWQVIKPDLINLSRGKTRLGPNAVATMERFLIRKSSN